MLIKIHLLALHKDLYHNPSKLVSFILISNFKRNPKILILLLLRLHQGPGSCTKKPLDTVDLDMKGLAVGSYPWEPTQSQLAINF